MPRVYEQNPHYNIYIVHIPHKKGKEWKQIRRRMEKKQLLQVNNIPGKIVN